MNIKSIIFALVILMGCQDHEVKPSCNTADCRGCQYGLSKVTGTELFIRCTDRKGHMAGTYEPNGGMPRDTWDKFEPGTIRFEECDRCK